MEEKVLVRAVIEVMGKPKEHIEKTMQGYILEIKKDDRFDIKREDFAEIKKQESELWATFTELEIEVKKIQDLISFCFEYMPSVIEIIQPANLNIDDGELSSFFNDLQARLHEVDMVAKQVKLENDHLSQNMAKLLKNYLIILLEKGSLSLSQLSQFTGVQEEKLGDYLDRLIDQGLVSMENGSYTLQREKLGKKQI